VANTWHVGYRIKRFLFHHAPTWGTIYARLS
jgi:hypothetical protein